MLIEVAEQLRCPLWHEGRQYCILLPERIEDRDVRSGFVACPVCRRHYPIVDGIPRMRHPDDDAPAPVADPPSPLPAAVDVAALLGVRGAGGYVVLAGSAGLLADGLAAPLDGVHFIVVNPPDGLTGAPSRSLLSGGRAFPLQSAMARGVVLGDEHARAPWLGEAARLLLRGLRMVALAEDVSCDDVERLASGNGMTVGQRR
jgi:uncharacterized protein YbaR (Trm112 family)